jgi:pimeloyl-ACP methyl ester carboxylesterase
LAKPKLIPFHAPGRDLSATMRQPRSRPWGKTLWSRFCIGLLLLALLVGGFFAGLAGSPSIRPKGQMVDIGGRRLRLTCEGPTNRSGPVVLFESGAFGFSGDWAYVQSALAAQGVRSCAYDRAGMGLSDPAREPRDGLNIAMDLERLLAAARIPGPYVLVGHSMAGARVHLFANRNPGKVVGLVLADSMTPESMDDPEVQKYVSDFTSATHMAAVVVSFGILRLLSWTPLGDKIGLPPEEDAEKRLQFASASYNRNAYDEVRLWPLAAKQARQTGPLNPNWPVAVVSAGVLDGGEGRQMLVLQRPPALASRHGYIAIVSGATHNGLLGARYSGAIVKGVDFVLAAVQAGKAAGAGTQTRPAG